MAKKVYTDTIKVYDTLGEKYLKDSKKVVPHERKDFMSQVPGGGHILDVGCGGGRDAEAFVRKGFQVTGIDLSSVFIKLAKKYVPKGKFYNVDLLTMDFPRHTFDAIWALAVLLHLERKDIPKALRRFYKVLKKDGLLHVRVKKGRGTALVSEKISGWHERFYTYFSKKEIEKMVRDAGFRKVSSYIVLDELGRKDVSWICVDAIK